MSDTEDEVREISQFSVIDMPKSYTALHCGPPGSGKTFSILSLAYMQSHIYPTGQVTCGTEGGQGGFSPVFGGLFVKEKFDRDVQTMASKRQVKAKNAKCPHYYSFHVVDDINFDKKALRDKTIIESIKNGTQWLFRAFHLGLHSPKDIHDDLSGFNYVFIYHQKDASLRRVIWTKYFRTYNISFKDFEKLMNDMLGSEKKGALVVDLKKSSSVLEECVFIFRAPYWKWPNSEDPDKCRPYPEGWRFGCQQHKDWNDARLNKDYIPDYIAELG